MKEEDFFEQYFTWAVVIRTTSADLQDIKEFLADKGVTIIFQKSSIGKLKIVPEEYEKL